MLVTMVFPGGDFFFEGRLVWNAPAQTFARQDAEFGFGHVAPASVFGGVVPFEPFGEVARFWRGNHRPPPTRPPSAGCAPSSAPVPDACPRRSPSVPPS